jgi:threonine dehydrogenase-like Zn-dependent dehydrogenase
LRSAALTEPVAIAMHAHSLSGVRPDDRVLVTGAGPVGLLMIAVLEAAGVDDITVSEPAPARRERAAALGATAVTPDSLPRAPMGRPVGEPFTYVFECSGRSAAVEAALDQLDRAGRFMFLGTGSETPRVNHNRVIVLEQTLLGSYNYDDHGFEAALALLASGRLPLDLLIEPDDVGLDAVGATMQRLGAGELAGKALVVPEVRV